MSNTTKVVSSAVLFLTVCVASPFLPSLAATVLCTACVLLIGGVGLRAIFASGTHRTFAIGFLVTSVTYIVTNIAVGDFTFKELGHRLPTTQLLQSFVKPAVSDPPVIQLVGPEARLRSAHGKPFIPLGHLLIAIAFGSVGGSYAKRLRTGQASEQQRDLAQKAVA
jgi:hypothetical protein